MVQGPKKSNTKLATLECETRFFWSTKPKKD